VLSGAAIISASMPMPPLYRTENPESERRRDQSGEGIAAAGRSKVKYICYYPRGFLHLLRYGEQW
jgi:hypothetical protein